MEEEVELVIRDPLFASPNFVGARSSENAPSLALPSAAPNFGPRNPHLLSPKSNRSRFQILPPATKPHGDEEALVASVLRKMGQEKRLLFRKVTGAKVDIVLGGSRWNGTVCADSTQKPVEGIRGIASREEIARETEIQGARIIRALDPAQDEAAGERPPSPQFPASFSPLPTFDEQWDSPSILPGPTHPQRASARNAL